MGNIQESRYHVDFDIPLPRHNGIPLGNVTLAGNLEAGTDRTVQGETTVSENGWHWSLSAFSYAPPHFADVRVAWSVVRTL